MSADNSASGRREIRVLPECATLAIGTVPHKDPDEAVDFMLRHHPECPSWPQLPRADFREGMYVQYSQGMPCVVLDLDEKSIFFDTTTAPEELTAFYEELMAGDLGRCAITSAYARSLEPMLARMPVDGARFIKGQVTGPASFGLTVTDEDNKPVLYHGDLFEAIVRLLACKGGWQESRFREAAPRLQTVLFFDEPYLTQVGSAMISLSAEQVVENLNRCFDAIEGLTGIHVCGGTDWGLLTSTNVDILHFDASDHAREFLIYERELDLFLRRGGMIAWGIIPTDERARGADAEAVAAAVLKMAGKLSGYTGGAISTGEVLRRSFISEACGTGTLEIELAEQCFSLATQVSRALKKQMC